MITNEEIMEYGCRINDLCSGSAIELDWQRVDQAWRIFRLQRVVGYLRAVADCTGNFEILRKVARILDHKGELTVLWHERPDDAEKKVFENAWIAEHESEDLVEHVLESQHRP